MFTYTTQTTELKNATASDTQISRSQASLLIAPGPVLPGVYILLCFASVRKEQEEIKAALSVCLQPTLLKRIAVEDEKEEA